MVAMWKSKTISVVGMVRGLFCMVFSVYNLQQIGYIQAIDNPKTKKTI